MDARRPLERRFLDPEEELWAREDRFERLRDAELEILFFAAARVERHQPPMILVADRPAERLRGDAADNVAGARRFLRPRERAARENTAAAWRIGDAGHAMRSHNAEAAQVRQRRDAKRDTDFRVGHRVIDGGD